MVFRDALSVTTFSNGHNRLQHTMYWLLCRCHPFNWCGSRVTHWLTQPLRALHSDYHCKWTWESHIVLYEECDLPTAPLLLLYHTLPLTPSTWQVLRLLNLHLHILSSNGPPWQAWEESHAIKYPQGTKRQRIPPRVPAERKPGIHSLLVKVLSYGCLQSLSLRLPRFYQGY